MSQRISVDAHVLEARAEAPLHFRRTLFRKHDAMPEQLRDRVVAAE